jgi:hypothetical protein
MMLLTKRAMRAAAAFACTLCLGAGGAHAESCGKSRDYILASAMDLPRPARVYNDLYKSCLEALQMSNVKDAFVLAVGAVAVLPRNDNIEATAGTLAQFCTRFPRYTLRFIGKREARFAKDVTQVVQLGTSASTPCQKVTGNG